jgi:FUN14 family
MHNLFFLVYPVGGGIILLQIANQQGYISIDWSKINKKVDKVTDKVEEAVTGEGPKWMDKVNTWFECCVSFNFVKFSNFLGQKICF